MSTSAIFMMLGVQIVVSVITIYFILLVLRKKQPDQKTGSKEQF